MVVTVCCAIRLCALLLSARRHCLLLLRVGVFLALQLDAALLGVLLRRQQTQVLKPAATAQTTHQASYQRQTDQPIQWHLLAASLDWQCTNKGDGSTKCVSS